MNPSALEDLWTVVRLAAEGSDWKRDQGETLCAWAQRRLKPSRGEAEQAGFRQVAKEAVFVLRGYRSSALHLLADKLEPFCATSPRSE